MCTIQEGDHVVLKRDDSLKVFEVKSSRQVYIDRLKFSLGAAVGELYGSVFEVKDGQLVKISRSAQADDIIVENERGEDNRELLDRESNQRLTSDNINKMKEEGVSGENIIEHLVENSATFKSKTEYSQEKYLKKKKKRHLPVYTILKPNTRLLSELYLAKGAHKIGYVRQDSLAQMLTYGNVQAGLTLAVVDNCQGLLLGAVLDRMGGTGRVVHLFPGPDPNRPVVADYNFPPEVLQTLYSYPLRLVKDLFVETDDTVKTGAADNIEEAKAEDDSTTEEKTEATEKGIKRKQTLQRKERREKSLQEARCILKSGNLDGLLVASTYDPVPIVSHLSPFVQPSRPVVVFSQYQEPLMDCYVKLREKNEMNVRGVNFRLTDSWLREYQILPERTHPLVRMNSTSGYILTFTTVTPD